MGRARFAVELPAPVSAAEALWYDPARWSAFVDGFHHVVKVEGEWPKVGSRVVWDSVPDGRGRVAERVVAYEVRSGQTLEVEDAQMTATQAVSFQPEGPDGSTIALELRWKLKSGGPFAPVVDALFVRRAFNDALRRTLSRFRRELQADRELGA
jgi:hypothetical protein